MKMIETLCAFCGNTFKKSLVKFNYTEKKKQKHYCNRTCYFNDRRGKTTNYTNKKILVKCDKCGNDFKKYEKQMLYTDKNFCSSACNGEFYAETKIKKIELVCPVCKCIFLRRPCYINYKKRFHANLFCSRKCTGYKLEKNITKIKIEYPKLKRRSQIEYFIEEKIKNNFSDLSVYYNGSYYGYELDLYFPFYNISIELNGPFHYIPIYSEESLIYTINRDKIRAHLCFEHNVTLHTIKLGRTRSIKEKEYYWEIVKNIIIDVKCNFKRSKGGFPLKSIKKVKLTADDIIYHSMNDIVR